MIVLFYYLFIYCINNIKYKRDSPSEAGGIWMTAEMKARIVITNVEKCEDRRDGQTSQGG